MTIALETLLGVPLPIVQAPMAGVQGSALALAAGAAGALGSLPAAMLPPDVLAAEVERLAAAGRPFNVNFFCHTPPRPDPARETGWRAALAPYYAELGLDQAATPPGPARIPFGEEVAALVEPFRPPVVSFHFGLPAPALLERVKRWGARVLSSATTVEEARWLEAHGADAIIAQGLEAGGHRGTFLAGDAAPQHGLAALLPDVVHAVRIPVIAAGGIGDAASVADAMALGAAGVQAGTAFLCCPEATTSALHRAALQRPGIRVTVLTNVFSGRPARGLATRLVRELGPLSPLAPEFPLAGGAVQPLRAAAERAGRDDFSPLWAGQGAGPVPALPAGEVVAALAKGLARNWPGRRGAARLTS